jgi:ACS family glucarate transporter-like MFS transporter
VTGATFFAYFHRSGLPIAAPFISKEFGLQPGMTGILLSSFFWIYAIAQIPSGWLVDKFGVGRAYAAGFVVWMVSGALMGIVQSFALLLLCRLVMGFGQGIVFPGNARTIANWFPASERGGATAAPMAGLRVGQAAITTFGAMLIAAWGWRSMILVTTVIGAVWLAPWIVFHWKNERTPIATQTAVSGITMPEVLALLKDRQMVGLVIAFFAIDYVWFLHATWMAGYFLGERKFSAGEMTLFVSMPLVAGSVLSVLAGLASDMLVRRGRSEIEVRRAIGDFAGTLLCGRWHNHERLSAGPAGSD